MADLVNKNWKPITKNEQKLYDLLKSKDEECKNLSSQLNDLASRLSRLEAKSSDKKQQLSSETVAESEYNTDEEQLAMDTEINEEELAPESGWVRQINRKKQAKKRKMDVSLSPGSPDLKPVKQVAPPNVPPIKKVPSPPSIVVDSIVNYEELYNLIKEKVNTDNFIMKLLNNNSIKINPKTGEDHRTISKILNESQKQWFSYENKQERPLRVMVKKLHHTCMPENIVSHLSKRGFKILEAVNKIGWRTKKPLDMFFLSFENTQDPKTVFEIQDVLNMKVEIHALKKNKLIVQCKKCQAFGHTKKFCGKEPRCVKCSEKHLTSDCNKSQDTEAKCYHCGQSHPANYRGCLVAKTLQKLKNDVTQKTVAGKTFAQVVSLKKNAITKEVENKKDTLQANTLVKTLERILEKLESFDERLEKLEKNTKGAIPKSRN